MGNEAHKWSFQKAFLVHLICVGIILSIVMYVQYRIDNQQEEHIELEWEHYKTTYTNYSATITEKYDATVGGEGSWHQGYFFVLSFCTHNTNITTRLVVGYDDYTAHDIGDNYTYMIPAYYMREVSA